jgi:hypothetical protein
MSKTTNKYAPEVRERAVRMVLDHRARQPARSSDRPHPAFLAWHRENCFKW